MLQFYDNGANISILPPEAVNYRYTHTGRQDRGIISVRIGLFGDLLDSSARRL